MGAQVDRGEHRGHTVTPTLRLAIDGSVTSLLTTASRQRSDLWMPEIGGGR